MAKKTSQRSSIAPRLIALFLVGFMGLSGAVIAARYSASSNRARRGSAVLADTSARFTLTSNAGIANQDGTSVTIGQDKAWIGTAGSTDQSYLGITLGGASIPANATIKSASIEFTAESSWIALGFTAFGDTSGKPVFSQIDRPSTRPLTLANAAYADNVKWEAGKSYSYDVTAPVRELVGSSGTSSISLILKGSGSKWGRKTIYGSPTTGKSPVLTVVYASSTAATATPVPTALPTIKPTATPIVTIAPTGTPIQTTTPSPTSVVTMPPMSMPPAGTPSTSIYGVVSAELLGTCSAAVHDRYITTGPDGKTYRTWHPTTVPVDAANPNGAKCTFAHEHGDDPSTSSIYVGPVAFDYVAAQIGMDEPHAGFKCFVHNKGTTNDEGGTALHNSYYCFHMGTGGAARFTTRFHSLEFHALTSGGARMDVQGLADVGEVGTICDNPRQQRTVMGFGCKLDSAYEIWENRLTIVNKGNLIAGATTSTAVFDPISVMDPADKTKLIYSWDPAAKANIFKFGDDRSSYRGCDREAYSGPLTWQNAGGTQIYYTDAYGNVTNGGALKQVISTVGMNKTGPLTQFGGLIMAYKGGNTADPQSQFKYRKSSCVPGLGVKN